MRTICIIFGEAIRIRVTKFKHNLPENYSKSTKIAITAGKFSKIFRGACPPDPLQLFLFFNQLQISSAEKKKLKKCGNYAPLLKFLATPLPTLVVGEKIWSLILAPPLHFRNASAIAGLYALFILMLVFENSFFGEKELLVFPRGCTLFATLQQLASLYFSQLTFLWPKNDFN